MNTNYIVYGLNNRIASVVNIKNSNDFFNSINISEGLRNSIFQRISVNKDFELTLSELQQLIPALSEKINNLISDPDFNPFKEREREMYPMAYNNFPFMWNGVTYYLYPKANDIDSEIRRVYGYLKLIQEHINQNKPLKYIYKNN